MLVHNCFSSLSHCIWKDPSKKSGKGACKLISTWKKKEKRAQVVNDLSSPPPPPPSKYSHAKKKPPPPPLHLPLGFFNSTSTAICSGKHRLLYGSLLSTLHTNRSNHTFFEWQHCGKLYTGVLSDNTVKRCTQVYWVTTLWKGVHRYTKWQHCGKLYTDISSVLSDNTVERCTQVYWVYLVTTLWKGVHRCIKCIEWQLCGEVYTGVLSVLSDNRVERCTQTYWVYWVTTVERCAHEYWETTLWKGVQRCIEWQHWGKVCTGVLSVLSDNTGGKVCTGVLSDNTVERCTQVCWVCWVTTQWKGVHSCSLCSG